MDKLDDILGSADKITITKDSTFIAGGKGSESEIGLRLEQIENDLESTPSNYDKEKLLQRKGKLIGGAGIIYVGGISEFEADELKDRVEDALNATRSAIKEGILPGGGVALYKLGYAREFNAKSDLSLGKNLLYKSIQEPIKQILYNAGLKSNRILRKINGGDFYNGYDLKKDKFGDLLALGVIDPTLVTITALKNAASVAGTLLTTECIIADRPISPDEIEIP